MKRSQPMQTIMPQATPLQPPCIGQGGSQGQPALPGILVDDSPLAWTMRIHEATLAAVAEYGGQDALAADMGISRQVLNQRLRRAQDSKGDVQRLHADIIGATFSGSTGAAARRAFIHALAGSMSYRVEEQRPPTDAEALRALAAEMTDKQRRRVEQERGWPKGWLDR